VMLADRDGQRDSGRKEMRVFIYPSLDRLGLIELMQRYEIMLPSLVQAQMVISDAGLDGLGPMGLWVGSGSALPRAPRLAYEESTESAVKKGDSDHWLKN
jgi:hypothetical protein